MTKTARAPRTATASSAQASPAQASSAAPPPADDRAGTARTAKPRRPPQVAPEPAVEPAPETASRQGLDRLLALAEVRIAIEAVQPTVDAGRFPAKRIVGEPCCIEADIFCDGHEQIDAVVQVRPFGAADWREVRMAPVENDRWAATVPLATVGRFCFRIEAWRDLFATWRADLLKKHAAGRDIRLELVEGRQLVHRAAEAAAEEGAALAGHRDRLEAIPDGDKARLQEALLAEDLLADMVAFGPRTNRTRSAVFQLVVDRPAARFAAWYELFPRSMSDDPDRHGTFDDVIAKLPYVRDMGFDVLYFPPIHPIGRTLRKGRNNSLTAGPDDPGSPYAIGAAEGGHDAIHPDLGTVDDFRRLAAAAHDHGLEIALDFAIQCSNDHPWIAQHPEWFDWRPDGTIKHAENPPKTYEDIVNVHFYRDALPDLWFALRDVVLHWVALGVRIFRVDNPHTKPLPFWEWLIAEVQERHPDTIFLSEAFTRPKMMLRLAKLGFTQSYTYFTWRTGKQELTDYLTELIQGPARDYFRPNFFVNTPDINPPYLHDGNPAMFRIRAALAATLSSLWGLYSGFELCEGAPLPGKKEEYLDSEKYQLRAWDWDRPGNIRADIRRLNAIRRANPALQRLDTLRFHTAHHDAVLYYGKATPAPGTEPAESVILTMVNLDPVNVAIHVPFELPLWQLGLADDAPVAVEDLLSGGRWYWYGKWQHMTLDPATQPYAIWRIARSH